MAKKRVNAVNPKTGKHAVAMVVDEFDNMYTLQFADGTTITIEKKSVVTF